MRGFLVAAVMTLALAGCQGSSTHAVSSQAPPSSVPSTGVTHKAPAHRGVITISRSGGRSVGDKVEVVEVQQSRWCVRHVAAPICAAVLDYSHRFRRADLRCKLGPGTTGVTGTIDGQAVKFLVPPVRCLVGRQLRHDASVIDLPSPL